MKYFLGITDIKKAKLRYRKLAKQLHPDKGGSTVEFQKMQNDYKELLLRLQQNQKDVISVHQPSHESELLNELKKLAKALIKQKVPQDYLRHKIQTTESPIKRSLFGNIVSFLDNLM